MDEGGERVRDQDMGSVQFVSAPTTIGKPALMSQGGLGGVPLDENEEVVHSISIDQEVQEDIKDVQPSAFTIKLTVGVPPMVDYTQGVPNYSNSSEASNEGEADIEPIARSSPEVVARSNDLGPIISVALLPEEIKIEE